MRGRPSGGITLVISQSIRDNYTTVIYKSDQVVANPFRRPKIAIFVSHFQPNFGIEGLIQEVADALGIANPGYHNVLFGDFNCRSDIPNEKQETLFDFLHDNSFICWNTPGVQPYISYHIIGKHYWFAFYQ